MLGRQKVEIPADLPREPRIIEPEREATCGCGFELRKFGDQVIERLSYEPAKIYVIKEHYLNWVFGQMASACPGRSMTRCGRGTARKVASASNSNTSARSESPTRPAQAARVRMRNSSRASKKASFSSDLFETDSLASVAQLYVLRQPERRIPAGPEGIR